MFILISGKRCGRIRTISAVMKVFSALALVAPCCAQQDKAVPSTASSSAEPKLPTDLDLVPRDAACFVHIRAADIWNSDYFADVRSLVGKAGPSLTQTFQKRFGLTPSMIDRITLIVVDPKTLANPFPATDPEAISALLVFRTAKAYDRTEVVRLFTREKRKKGHGGISYFFNETYWSALYFVDERTFIVGSEDALIQFFDLPQERKTQGVLQGALEEANGRKHVVAGLDLTKVMKAMAFPEPPDYRPFFKAQRIMVTVDVAKETRFIVAAHYAKEDLAASAEPAFRALVELGGKGLELLVNDREQQLQREPLPIQTDWDEFLEKASTLVAAGTFQELNDTLKAARPERRGQVLQLPLSYNGFFSSPTLPIALAFVYSFGTSSSQLVFEPVGTIPGYGDVSGKAIPDRAVKERLEKLASAMDKYNQAKGHLPPPAINDDQGRPLLSWRVTLLPHLGEMDLYKQFKLDEPWDSLNNKKLLKKMPDVFRHPMQIPRNVAEKMKTPYQVFIGVGTAFPAEKRGQNADLPGQTVLIVQRNDKKNVYWTKPAEITYDSQKPLPDLSGKSTAGYQAILKDGAVRTIGKTMDEKTIRTLISPVNSESR